MVYNSVIQITKCHFIFPTLTGLKVSLDYHNILFNMVLLPICFDQSISSNIKFMYLYIYFQFSLCKD